MIRLQITAYQIQQVDEKQMKERLKRVELLNLTRELARLIQAGLPLYDALMALEEKYKGQTMDRLLLSLCDSIRSGLSLSQSLAKHPKVFNVLYQSMIANAEKTGKLSFALNELADLIAKQQHLRKKLLTALLYPAMLAGFCLVVLSSLLFYVIPSLKELFLDRELHPFTQIVFTLSEIACNAKSILAGLFLG